MGSPDLPGYIDLTLLDQSPADLVAAVRTHLLTTLPGFVYRAGSVTAALIDGLALMMADRVYATNRLPPAVFETLMGRIGVAFDQGAAPTASITVTVADNAGYIIPAGTRFRLDLSADETVVFTLNAALNIGVGTTSNAAPAAVTGTSNTAIANGTLIGTVLQVVDPISAINAVVFATAPTGGRGAEAVADWFDRGAAQLSTFSSVLTTAAQFKAKAPVLEPAVVRVEGYDRFDVSLGTGNPGDHPGHISLVVGTASGDPLTTLQKTNLEAGLEDLARVEVDVHLFDPTISDARTAITVVKDAAYTVAEVQANILAALDAYFDPAVWPFGSTVYLNELISLIDGVAGVVRVTSVTIGTANQLSSTNSSLEAGVGDWAADVNCAATQQATLPYLGANSLRMRSAAAGDMSAVLAAAGAMACAPGEIVTGLGFVRAATVARNTRIAVEFLDAANAVLATTWGALLANVTTGHVMPFVTTGAAPALTAKARLKPQVQGTAAANEDHHWDAFLIGKGGIVRYTAPVALAAADLAITGRAPLVDHNTAGTVITVV